MDARVRIVGVATSRFDAFGRPETSTILMNDLDDLDVLSPSPGSPYDEPAATIAALKALRGETRVTRRNRLEATVNLAWPDRLFLTDQTGWIEARLTDSAPSFAAGDKVNLLGFLQNTPQGVRLEDATGTLLSAGAPPPARPYAAQELLKSEYVGERVSVQGKVLDIDPDESYYSALMDGDGTQFKAIIPRANLSESPPHDLKAGATVRTTGTCIISARDDWHGVSLQILLNKPEDLEVITPAPRYSPQTLMTVIGSLAIVLATAFGWGAMQRLRATRTEVRFAKAIEASPIPVAITNRSDFRLREINNSFLAQFKLKREDTMGRRLAELGLAPEGERLTRFNAELKQKSSVRTLQCPLKDRDGGQIDTLITAEPIQFENTHCLLFIYQDVTEHLQLMNQLRDAQKLEAVGRLAAGIAHDFNNLITIVQGNNELLQLSIPRDEENDSLLRSSKAASQRIAELTRQLLTFSRKQIIRRTPISLDELVRNASGACLEILGDNIQVSRNLHAGDLRLLSDATMMRQMFQYLAENAREAMPDGGEFLIETDSVIFRDDNLPEAPDATIGRFGKIIVSDTGAGMDTETLARAFEPFFTTKDVGQGSGLGLSTVFGIVKQHGGWVSLESSPGQGCRVEIFLPAGETVDP